MEVSPLRAYFSPVPNRVAIYPSKECGVYSFKVKKYSSVLPKRHNFSSEKQGKMKDHTKVVSWESCSHFHLYLTCEKAQYLWSFA